MPFFSEGPHEAKIYTLCVRPSSGPRIFFFSKKENVLNMKKSIGASSTHKVIFGASKLLALSAKPISLQNEATGGAINQIPSVIRPFGGRIKFSAKKKKLLMGKNCIESCRPIMIISRQTATPDELFWNDG